MGEEELEMLESYAGEEGFEWLTDVLEYAEDDSVLQNAEAEIYKQLAEKDFESELDTDEYYKGLSMGNEMWLAGERTEELRKRLEEEFRGWK